MEEVGCAFVHDRGRGAIAGKLQIVEGDGARPYFPS